MNELALTESPSLRAQHVDRVDVLDKVKALSLLPDGAHADIPIVANYYEVTPGTIEKVVQRNRAELTENGLRVLKGAEYRAFATDNLSAANPNARSATIFTRKAILNVGQLLVDSTVAKDVRAYLLNLEEVATHEQRAEAIDRVELAKARIEMLAAADGYLDSKWVRLKMRVQAAIGLGEEPEIEPDDLPLYVPDFLKSKGLKKKDVEATQSTFGRRAAALYEAEHGFKPGKRQAEIPNGSVRQTLAWTQKDLPLFEEVWDRWYAAKHTPQFELFGADT
ncbi:hypothetical protein FHR32_005064 [Streptosporangium album]|uniref:Uncharacterized protein n=1 Tax=Streptosporangium album TaxID=47479 RepID=A0A7W7RZA4_9ACTN|nr:hypothetical protein [Streptosporangium album]MBB4940687.1 hypothetical protein [Streptosporangium album]